MTRKIIIAALTALLVVAAYGKDVRTLVVTTQPRMHCSTCETTIKGNMRFERGVKQIETDIAAQTVTITYDADKTDEDALIAAFGRFGYRAEKMESAAATPDDDAAEKAEKAEKAE